MNSLIVRDAANGVPGWVPIALDALGLNNSGLRAVEPHPTGSELVPHRCGFIALRFRTASSCTARGLLAAVWHLAWADPENAPQQLRVAETFPRNIVVAHAWGRAVG